MGLPCQTNLTAVFDQDCPTGGPQTAGSPQRVKLSPPGSCPATTPLHCSEQQCNSSWSLWAQPPSSNYLYLPLPHGRGSTTAWVAESEPGACSKIGIWVSRAGSIAGGCRNVVQQWGEGHGLPQYGLQDVWLLASWKNCMMSKELV